MRRAHRAAIGYLVAQMIVNGAAHGAVAGHVEQNAGLVWQHFHLVIGQHLMVAADFLDKILVSRRGQTDGLAFVGVVIDQKMPETESGFTRRAGDDDIAGAVKRVPRDEVFQEKRGADDGPQQALHIVKLGAIAGLSRHARIFAVKSGY